MYLYYSAPYKIVEFLGKIFAFVLYCILKVYPTKTLYWSRAKRMSRYVLEQIIIDQLIPTIAVYYKESELLDIFSEIKYQNIDINHTNQNSWSILLTK